MCHFPVYLECLFQRELRSWWRSYMPGVHLTQLRWCATSGALVFSFILYALAHLSIMHWFLVGLPFVYSFPNLRSYKEHLEMLCALWWGLGPCSYETGVRLPAKDCQAFYPRVQAAVFIPSDARLGLSLVASKRSGTTLREAQDVFLGEQLATTCPVAEDRYPFGTWRPFWVLLPDFVAHSQTWYHLVNWVTYFAVMRRRTWSMITVWQSLMVGTPINLVRGLIWVGQITSPFWPLMSADLWNDERVVSHARCSGFIRGRQRGDFSVIAQ